MTSINITKVNDTVVVSLAGHAEYSKNGNDIVCAALSAITQSFLQTLKYYESKGKCIVKSEQIKEDIGTALFSFTSMSEKETDALLSMALIGYTMLKNTYPKNIFLNCDL